MSINQEPVRPEDFTKIKVIGTGVYGKVFLVQKVSDGQYYAMKKIRKDLVFETNNK